MSDLAAQALQSVDRILSEKPERSPEHFADALRCLASYRDSLVSGWREAQSVAGLARLREVNAVISVVMAGKFPLGAAPWEHIEQARASLAGTRPALND